ncbi:hypothetical protein IR128_11325 [Staphylococcus lentus]|uniref:DUF7365 family protein n=1 Tax=Mammaliicoccus lentus TaxID=42858 RepID=UPI0018833129|nr:hypothetical protein [Mammaliicoccus lentus]MBF0842300.1 hypothetical protein [Mammaliicoccus lentus]
MENEILKWVVTVVIPIFACFLPFLNKAKEQEHRLTLIETDLAHVQKISNDIFKRLENVEKNHEVLIRVEERLDNLIDKTEKIEKEIETLRRV